MQRPGEAAGGEGGVEGPGLIEGSRVDDGDRVEPRPLLVVGIDARQVALDQPLAREVARPEGLVDLGDRGLLDRECLCLEREGGRRERQGEREGQPECDRRSSRHGSTCPRGKLDE